MQRLKRIYVFCICFLIILSFLTPLSIKADGSSTDWCQVTINQTGVGHGSGCTTVSLQLILQNSQTLPSDLQLSGNITSATDVYKNFDKKTEGFHSGDAWLIGNFANTCTSLSNATWSGVSSVDGQTLTTKDYNSTKAIVGFGGKDFRDMSYEEQVTSMKAFYNSGYFVVFCVEYKGVNQQSNGASGYKAAHATVLAGVDNGDIYINDPANGQVCLYKDRSAKGGAYNLVYVELFKNDKTSPLSLSGSSSIEVTEQDKIQAENLGVSVQALRGYYSEDQLSAYCKLAEVDLTELLNSANRNSLEQSDIEGLANWERNINNNTSDSSIIHYLRIFTMFMGIILIVWSVLVYLAYWFDRINNFFDLDLLGILTFGRLHMSDTEEKCTFKVKDLGKTEKKTVNHRAICFVCLSGICFGVLIVSDMLYKILYTLIHFIKRLFI